MTKQPSALELCERIVRHALTAADDERYFLDWDLVFDAYEILVGAAFKEGEDG